MRTPHWRVFFIRLLLLSPLAMLAQGEDVEPVQSDWLELVKGYKGETLGTEMREIEDDGENRTVTLAIPKESISHPDSIEEVVVVGRKPEELEPLEIEYKWLDDYDDDNYGLVIYLGRNSRWPIRFYLNSDPGFIR
jgi:hypothetical protein